MTRVPFSITFEATSELPGPPADVMIRAPTNAIAPSGVSLFAVKPMLTPFASGASIAGRVVA